MSRIMIEYGWNSGSKFLSEPQQKTFRSLIAQLRKFGFTKRQWSWTVEYSIEDNELGFNDSVRVIRIVQHMVKLMKTAEQEYYRRCKSWKATHGTKYSLVSVYGDVFIVTPSIKGIDADSYAYLSSIVGDN